MFTNFLQGFLIGASLIIAIGPQNAFIINQGVRRQHVLLTAVVCSLTDVVLISAGVFGLGALLKLHPAFVEAARWFGAAFLVFYGGLKFKAAFHPDVLTNSPALSQSPSIKRTVLTLLALGLLNPHAYLDAVVLLGSIAAQHTGVGHYYFGFGAIFASFVWFFSITFGAQILSPLFKKALAWQVLDVLTGGIMWVIACILLFR